MIALIPIIAIIYLTIRVVYLLSNAPRLPRNQRYNLTLTRSPREH